MIILKFQSTFPRGERQYFPLTNIYCYIFQSTFPRGEQQGTVMSLEHRVYFNPRSRVGNDEKRVYGIVKPNIISIHIPAWGTTRKTFWCSTKSYFNPRSRVGNDSLFRTSSASSTYFNPRSRVGNDGSSGFDVTRNGISIHVPAWGTTNIHIGCNRSYTISIHVPAWGTTAWYSDSNICSGFQSTFPRGERQKHTRPDGIPGTDFNPRSRVGNDNGTGTTMLTTMLFQSTFPRGERHLQQTTRYWLKYFNPRSRVENDQQTTPVSLQIPQFQSTFPRGERRSESISYATPQQFQSTFPRGERRTGGTVVDSDYRFQSTFPRGERHIVGMGCKASKNFNPRSRVGNDG